MDIINIITETKIRLDRGNVLIGWFRNVVIIVASLKYIISLSIIKSITLGIILMIIFYIIGIIDIDCIKIYQKEQELISSKYNSHLDKIKRIRK